MLDSFPYTTFEDTGTIDKTYIANGFNFDDQGKDGEMGSNLRVRIYSLETFVFGFNDLWGENVSGAIKFSIEEDDVLPLLDIGEPGMPQIDSLVVVGVQSSKVIVSDPQPYQESIYLVKSRVEDTYYPNA